MNCPDCGSEMKMLYPGNDPENGPAKLRCPKGCYGGELCDICGQFWHNDPKDTPNRPGIQHDSFGNGLPEVDEENEKFEKMFPIPETKMAKGIARKQNKKNGFHPRERVDSGLGNPYSTYIAEVIVFSGFNEQVIKNVKASV